MRVITTGTGPKELAQAVGRDLKVIAKEAAEWASEGAWRVEFDNLTAWVTDPDGYTSVHELINGRYIVEGKEIAQ